MNNICMIGRVTADIELKQTQSGVSVCSFTLAVDRPNVKDTTDFIPCVAWKNTAEFVSRYFTKGQRVAVIGCLTTRKYEDRDGKKRTAYEVVCDRCEFCDSKQNAADLPPQYSGNNEPQFEEIKDDGDLPF